MVNSISICTLWPLLVHHKKRWPVSDSALRSYLSFQSIVLLHAVNLKQFSSEPASGALLTQSVWKRDCVNPRSPLTRQLTHS